jgi:TonB family protein
MPITQIPFQDPVAPPEKPQPEQLGLYDARGWETAYRDLDANVPHLLIQLQDDLARSRWREALWISIIVHMILTIGLWNANLIQKLLPWRSAVVVPVSNTKDKDLTFLALPSDAEKIPQKPKTNVLSDKNRIASTRHPQLDPKELRRILTPPPGAPGMPAPRAEAPPAAAQGAPPVREPQENQQAASRPQFQSNQEARLHMPAPADNAFQKYAAGMSAGSAIQQATQAAAANRAAGGGGQGGDYGLDNGEHGRRYGALEILSDTQGVDFGPYLQRVYEDVRQNWYRLIPESAMMGKKGKLAIDFKIAKDGSVEEMTLKLSTGDVALDRAAWGSITASNPFPPLPAEFGGADVEFLFRFYYNPDKSDLE